MKNISLVVLCAGNSTRFNSSTKKQWIRIKDKPLWLFVTDKLSKYYNFTQIIVVGNPKEIKYMQNFTDDYKIISGGDSRQDSMKNGLKYVDTKYVMFTDVARACISKDIIKSLIKHRAKADCIVPFINASDTVVYNNKTINRDNVKLIQTPQLSLTKKLKKALKTDIEFSDDSSAIKDNGGSIHYIKGSNRFTKITFGKELKNLSCLKKPSKDIFSGIGVDIHPFENNKKMYLGGVEIKNVDYGFMAHSDGDVLIHSLIDALIGAIGAGDIGEFFPDTSDKYKNIDSKILLKEIVKFINSVGYKIINVDIIIIAQKPKIGNYKYSIKNLLASILKIKKQYINIKATTAEKLGFVGRGEGMSVQCIANLKYDNWKK